jgi:uncharacterized protein
LTGLVASPPAALRRRRLLELVVLFGLGPAALSAGPGWLVIPAILGGAALCWGILRWDPGYRREGLAGRVGPETTGREPIRGVLIRLLLRTAVGWLVLLLLVAWLEPEALFIFPRQRPGFWLLVMIGYPLLSALPQEFIFRTFFFHRYEALIRPARARIVVSALLFGYAHIVLHNLPSVVLSTVGGLLFASTYQKTRSTWLVALEHALYGCFVFSVGMGSLFYAGGRSVSATFRSGG